MPLVPTKHAIVKLDHFSSVGEIDPLTHQAWLGAGAKLHDLSPQLSERGYAFRNLGDIDVQTFEISNVPNESKVRTLNARVTIN